MEPTKRVGSSRMGSLPPRAPPPIRSASATMLCRHCDGQQKVLPAQASPHTRTPAALWPRAALAFRRLLQKTVDGAGLGRKAGFDPEIAKRAEDLSDPGTARNAPRREIHPPDRKFWLRRIGEEPVGAGEGGIVGARARFGLEEQE